MGISTAACLARLGPLVQQRSVHTLYTMMKAFFINGWAYKSHEKYVRNLFWGIFYTHLTLIQHKAMYSYLKDRKKPPQSAMLTKPLEDHMYCNIIRFYI